MTAPVKDAPDDQRLLVVFPGHYPLWYRVSRALAQRCADDLRACCPGAQVVVDDGLVAGMHRLPLELLWQWTI